METVTQLTYTKLDLGSGRWIKEGHIGIDNLEAATFQGMTEEERKRILQWDLNFGIPYPDNCITDIYCSHFLEHVKDPMDLLDEVLRVCMNAARVEIYVPIREMLSVGHITEFHEDWFEQNIPKLWAWDNPVTQLFTITFKEINLDKPAELRLPDGTKSQRKFDELHIIMKVVK